MNDSPFDVDKLEFITKIVSAYDHPVEYVYNFIEALHEPGLD